MTPSQSPLNAPAAQQQLGWQARLRWAHGICQGLPAVAEQLDAFFSTQSSSVSTQREMQDWREAWSSFQAHRAAWVQASAQALQQAARKPPLGDGRPSASAPLTFELVGDDVVENKILASRMALAMGEELQSGFEPMRLRIQILEGQDLPAQDMFRAETICQHLVEQWMEAGMERSHLLRVTEPLHNALAPLLASEYGILHKLLDAKGVSKAEDAPLRVRRTESTAPASASMQLDSGGSGFSGFSGPGLSGYIPPGMVNGAQAGMGVPGAAQTGLSMLARARHRALDAMNQLRQVLSQPGIGLQGLIPGVPATPMPPASAALAQALQEQQLIATQLQTQYLQGAGTAMGMPMTAMDYSPAALGQLANLLRERSADWKQKAETKGEKATIEVVALMFQSILSEDRLPPSIRVWFARLQVPVLRVALAEPQFFSDLNHPARKLIDRMGSCVMGFDASSINGNALEVEIRRVVQVIEQYPETGQKVFALVLREFEEFLTKHFAQNQSTAKITSVAQQVEQKETLAIQYTIELRNMLADMPVREEVRDFLFKSWADVLAMATVRYGAKDAQAMRFKQAASELVWSASAKPSRQERARVIQGLPTLLQTLRQGLELVSVTGDEQSAQIKKLTDTLAEAFVSKTAAIAPARIEAMAKRLSELENYISDDGTLDDMPLSTESIEMMLGVDTADLNVIPNTDAAVEPAMLEWAQALETGRWFTLDHNGVRTQVQYVWRSRRKQLHLFASLDGHCHLLQLQRMAVYLQTGLLAVHDEEALTVRATRDALQKIQANPERLA
ncbi:DUF1631 domain-containing protein [Comamonas testosteroni]|uniref:DUF1631 domain-containing protein n=1 Tax=Comamonas testosteroni TaxID=285 RepID=A0A373FQR1_COMTE|nr:DUF1631 domain-containing protein [Comamonas testosteroni]RGE46466.1 DUF1631 domain-containing protein [Comamonas testosteroni]